jgi:hypothetical protein
MSSATPGASNRRGGSVVAHSSWLLGTREFLVIQHTDRGMAMFTDEMMAEVITDRCGQDVSELDFPHLPRSGSERQGLEDSIPESLRAPLVDTLRGFTARADRCWCCIWEGYGAWFGGRVLHEGKRPSAMRKLRREAEPKQVFLVAIPKASIMGGMRECLVFTGAIDAIPGLQIGGWSHTPNWWWPDDRAWNVVSELDAPSTYAGGSAGLVQAILDEPRLEAVPSDPGHRFDGEGDRINAPEGPCPSGRPPFPGTFTGWDANGWGRPRCSSWRSCSAPAIR